MTLDVTPDEAARLLEQGALYLDVRTPEEFEEGHPPAAWNLPLQLRAETRGLTDNPRFAELARAWLEPSRVVVVGCRSGARSTRAAEQLARHGFDVRNMLGGMEGARDAFGSVQVPGWRQTGLPVEYELDRSYGALLAGAACS